MNSVCSARLVTLTTHQSATGNLTALTTGDEVPFAVRRFFFIADVPSGVSRGDHAHKTCEQFVFPTAGSVHAEVRDTAGSMASFDLATGESGLYVPAQLWLLLRASSHHTCIGVLASGPYDPADYIRDWEEFIGQGYTD